MQNYQKKKGGKHTAVPRSLSLVDCLVKINTYRMISLRATPKTPQNKTLVKNQIIKKNKANPKNKTLTKNKTSIRGEREREKQLQMAGETLARKTLPAIAEDEIPSIETYEADIFFFMLLRRGLEMYPRRGTAALPLLAASARLRPLRLRRRIRCFLGFFGGGGDGRRSELRIVMLDCHGGNEERRR